MGHSLTYVVFKKSNRNPISIYLFNYPHIETKHVSVSTNILLPIQEHLRKKTVQIRTNLVYTDAIKYNQSCISIIRYIRSIRCQSSQFNGNYKNFTNGA